MVCPKMHFHNFWRAYKFDFEIKTIFISKTDFYWEAIDFNDFSESASALSDVSHQTILELSINKSIYWSS